jgi:hypothetical protein
MVGTVGAARSVRLSVAAYALGLAVGSVVVFGGLGLLGEALHPGRTALVAAALVAVGAIAADLRGASVRPQIRFQVPERWRRTMPLPLAMLLYGMVLGTGFTTYVSAAAAWMLLVFVVSLGSPASALVVGLSFAAGRAVVVRAGERRLTARPGALRLVRALAAASLAVAAVSAGTAGAATVVAAPAGDPSVAGEDLAWEEPGVGGFLRSAAQTVQLPGHDPAIGGALVAWHVGDAVTVATRATLEPLFEERIVGARRLAVSDRWLAFTAIDAKGVTRLTAQSIADTSKTTAVASVSPPAQIGRPSIDGDLIVFHVATRRASWIQAVDLAAGKRSRLRKSTSAQLLSPVVLGGRLLYVKVSRCAQQLRLGAAGGGAEHVLLTLPPLAGWDLGHEKRHTKQGERLPCRGRTHSTATSLWTTALASGAAYVTTLHRSGGRIPTPTLIQIPR